MDRASLEKLLGQGLSLAEIGRRFGRHESTVAYWVDKHGLKAVGCEKHAAKGPLAYDELESFVRAGLSIAEIAEVLGRGKASVRHWLKKHALPTEPGSRRKQAREARQLGLCSVKRSCRRHGNTDHYLDHRGYYRCRLCRQEAVVRRRRKVKEILIAESGGCCQLCGYDRCAAALEFHHLNPGEKQFGVASRGLARSIERVRAEVRKCILLCSNCHAEVECGFSSISGVAQMGDPG